MGSDHPKIRYGIEGFPVEHDGRQMILLRDRLGYSADSLVISKELAPLLMQMNGQNSIVDLQAFYMRTTGELLFSDQLQEILDKLDQNLFLDNERFRKVASEALAQFQRDPVRRMQFAEKSYPEAPASLRDMLGSYFAANASESAAGEGSTAELTLQRRLKALVAPHIDIQAGGPCFASAYQAAIEASSPETWVVLGTGHEPLRNYFALTCKDFETPLGTVEHDSTCCGLLDQFSPRNLHAGEYTHQREHTIEFQAVFLAYTQPRAKIVPLLCSFSLEEWAADHEYIDGIAGILRDLPRLSGRPVGIIASVDLAHIGPRYGDPFKPHQGTVRENLAGDRPLLEALARCDASAFLEKLRREGNQRRICGVAPLYMLAKAMEGNARGEILQHAHATVDHQGSFVTFASMAFYEASSEPGENATT